MVGIARRIGLDRLTTRSAERPARNECNTTGDEQSEPDQGPVSSVRTCTGQRRAVGSARGRHRYRCYAGAALRTTWCSWFWRPDRPVPTPPGEQGETLRAVDAQVGGLDHPRAADRGGVPAVERVPPPRCGRRERYLSDLEGCREHRPGVRLRWSAPVTVAADAGSTVTDCGHHAAADLNPVVPLLCLASPDSRTAEAAGRRHHATADVDSRTLSVGGAADPGTAARIASASGPHRAAVADRDLQKGTIGPPADCGSRRSQGRSR